jgi:hypothetical protein
MWAVGAPADVLMASRVFCRAAVMQKVVKLFYRRMEMEYIVGLARLPVGN